MITRVLPVRPCGEAKFIVATFVAIVIVPDIARSDIVVEFTILPLESTHTTSMEISCPITLCESDGFTPKRYGIL